MKISPKQSPSNRWLIASLHKRQLCSQLGTSHVFWYFLGQFFLKVVFFRVSKMHGLVFLGVFFRFSDGHPYSFSVHFLLPTLSNA